MSPINPVFALAVLSVGLATVWVLPRPVSVRNVPGRYASIDGLRGYLAFFVFVHHSAVWYFYLRDGQWAAPPSKLFNQLGLGSVALFFMITGFLFVSKLIDARAGTFSWTRMFVSRVFRLTPLYLFAMAVLAFIVAQLSGFTVHERTPYLLANSLRWVTFTIAGEPPINQIQETAMIVAGVTWSLAYEWAFYFSLPIIALLIWRRPVPMPFLVLSVTFLIGFAFLKPEVPRLLPFVGGVIGAILVRVPILMESLSGVLGTSVALGALAAISLFPSGARLDPRVTLCLTITFVIVACGNDLFGVLSTSLSRRLGDISYSLYLLHGIVLFVTFKFLIGFEAAKALDTVRYWTVVAGCTVVLIALCSSTFEMIELPFNSFAPRIGKRLDGWVIRAHRLASSQASLNSR